MMLFLKFTKCPFPRKNHFSFGLPWLAPTLLEIWSHHYQHYVMVVWLVERMDQVTYELKSGIQMMEY